MCSSANAEDPLLARSSHHTRLAAALADTARSATARLYSWASSWLIAIKLVFSSYLIDLAGRHVWEWYWLLIKQQGGGFTNCSICFIPADLNWEENLMGASHTRLYPSVVDFINVGEING